MSSILSKNLITIFTFALAIPVTTTTVVATSPPPIIIQKNTNSTQLINRAKQLYQDEQYVEASLVWQQAATVFKEEGNTLNQSMALSNLALTQQKLGKLPTAEKSIADSLELLQNQSVSTTQQRLLANTLDIQGSLKRSQGEARMALDAWKQAEQIYQELDNNRAVVNNLINQAQALQDLGYYRRASKILTSAQAKLDLEPDSEQKILAFLSFGNNLRSTGNLEQSHAVLQEAIKIADSLEANQQKNLILISLGNTLRALGNRASESRTIELVSVSSPNCLADLNSQQADNYYLYYLQAANCYQQTNLSSEPNITVKANLNLLSLAVHNQSGRIISAQSYFSIPDLISSIKTNLAKLPINRKTVFDRLNLVNSLICLQPNTLQFSSPLVQTCQPLSNQDLSISWEEIEQEAKIALEQANQLQDRQAQAYSLGYLGAIYQQMERFIEAEQFTQKALLTIDSNTTPELTYLWQWQLGRIYTLQNKPEKALQSYNNTFDILQALRQNLVAVDSNMQFAFRDRIEPIYREHVALLLRENNPNQTNLEQARDTIEALQLAELNNFFQEACIDAKPQRIEDIDPSGAVIYSIILPDGLAIILSQPEQPLRYYFTIIDPEEIDRVFEDLYANLIPFLSPTNPLKPNQTFYNWLIRPLESQLEQNKSKTLVFILDGVMRGIPVASLHDGKQYLIEKYALALTPGLQLLTSRSLTSGTLETIGGGLTQPRQGFSSLPNVGTEFLEISNLVTSEILLDESFTSDNLQAEVTDLPYPIVHLATHGQFSSRAEDTFLLTWDDRINVKDLDQLLQARNFAEDAPIELLILSACQTAAGDKRAALGLAGVAVRSGARSTVATLWAIRDDSTAEFMTQFYRVLQNREINKAEALRQAQLSLLRSSQYQHPFYWSAFVLVGNWL